MVTLQSVRDIHARVDAFNDLLKWEPNQEFTNSWILVYRPTGRIMAELHFEIESEHYRLEDTEFKLQRLYKDLQAGQDELRAIAVLYLMERHEF